MFYDMFLDELIYLREEKEVLLSPDIFEGLIKYTKNEVDLYKNGKVLPLKNIREIFDFIKTSRNVFTNNSKLYYGKLSDSVSKKISDCVKFDLRGFNLSLQMHNVKRIFKSHGDPIKEYARGQISVIDNDFVFIPFILSNFDEAMISNKFVEYNNIALVFKKKIDSIIYNLVMYISPKNHNLEVKTLFKQRKKELLL